TISNGAQNLTMNKTVPVGGAVQPPPPPPPPPPTGNCGTMSNSNMFVGVTGTQSGCTAAQPNCKTGEPITFSMSTFGYNQNCASHTVSWSFGDGSATGPSVSHSFASDGQHTVYMTVNNGSQSFTAQQ